MQNFNKAQNLKIENTPTKQKVASKLRNAILSEEIKNGTRLVLSELETSFQISRTPIREGLLILENEGLVYHECNKEFIVRGMTDQFIKNYFELRIIFEAEVIRLCASKGPELLGPLQLLQTNIENRVDNLTTDTYDDYNYSFHSTLWLIADNIRLIGFLELLWNGPKISYYANPQDFWHKSIKEHREVFNAMIKGEGNNAIKINEVHLNRCCKELLAAWENKKH